MFWPCNSCTVGVVIHLIDLMKSVQGRIENWIMKWFMQSSWHGRDVKLQGLIWCVDVRDRKDVKKRLISFLQFPLLYFHLCCVLSFLVMAVLLFTFNMSHQLFLSSVGLLFYSCIYFSSSHDLFVYSTLTISAHFLIQTSISTVPFASKPHI